MSNNRSKIPADPRPTLLLCCAIVGVIAALSVVAAIILTALDANAAPDLPDPLVNNIGDLAASSSVICITLLGIHILRRTSSRNTSAIMEASGNLKSDTGEIPNLAELMRNPHIVVVRDPGPYDKLDRGQTMRVGMAASQPKAADRDLYWKTYTDAVTDLAGLNGIDDSDGPAAPTR